MIPNEFSGLFLTKKQQQKLVILQQLKKGLVNIPELARSLGISERSVKEISVGLSEDLKEENFNNFLVISKGSIQLEKELVDEEYILSVIAIRKKYLFDSNLFRVLLFILEMRTFSIVQLAEEFSYSVSYCYKVYKKIEKFFQVTNAKIFLNKTDDIRFALVGDESSIRILHYLCVSSVSKGNHWMFTSITEKEILSIQKYLNSNRYKRLSSIGKNKVNYILAVYEISLKNGYYIEDLDEDIRKLGHIFRKERELNLYLKYLKEEKFLQKKTLPDDLIHLAFIANYFSQELTLDSKKESLGEEIANLKNNKFVEKCAQLLDLIKVIYPLSNRVTHQLLYSLCIRLVVIHYFGLSQFMPLYQVPPLKSKIEKTVESCIEKVFLGYTTEVSLKKIKYSFTQIIVSYILLELPITQNIYIEFFYRPQYKPIIENAIRHNYSSKVIKIVEDYRDADIVISDTYDYPNKKYFYFSDVFDQYSWEQLGNFLNQVIKSESI